MDIPHLTFYTTEGCHLCEDALTNIKKAQLVIDFQVERIDIQDQYETYEKFKDDIPVLMLGNLEIGRHRIPAELIVEKIKESILNA